MLPGFFRIRSLQLIKEKLSKLTAFLSLHVFGIKLDINKNKFESRLHYFDIIAYHRIYETETFVRSIENLEHLIPKSKVALLSLRLPEDPLMKVFPAGYIKGLDEIEINV